jgi:uncharacterized protein YndB with AHSA1/START domain
MGSEMKLLALAVVVAAMAVASPAQAEVRASSPDGMIIQIKGEVALGREATWARLIRIGSWWSDGHTYSGKASSMTVDAVAGGCWCEMWEGGEVEHGRVIYIQPNKAVRFASALGPLQGLGVNGVLTFTLADGSAPGKTAVTVDMNVTGSSLSDLDKMAAPVNGVLQEQFDRLTKP